MKIKFFLISLFSIIFLAWMISASTWGTGGFAGLTNASIPSALNTNVNTAGQNIESGIIIVPFKNFSIATLNSSASPGGNRMFIRDNNGSGLIGNSSITGSYAAMGNITLIAGHKYNITMTSTSGSWTVPRTSSTNTFPYTSFADFNVTSVIENDGHEYTGVQNWWAIQSIEYYANLTSYLNLTSPTNNTITNNPSISFNVSVSVVSSSQNKNITLYLDGIPNMTNSVTGNINSTVFNLNLSDGVHTWTAKATDNDSASGFAPNNFTINVLTHGPGILIYYPNSSNITYGYIGLNTTLNFSASSSFLSTCWLNYNGTNTTIPCTSNSSFLIAGINKKNLTLYANDSAGNLNSNFTAFNFDVFQNSINYNSSTYASQSESFQLNITTSKILSSAYLIYNGTAYSSSFSQNGNNITLLNSLIIPAYNSYPQNVSFYYELMFTDANINSTTSYQIVQNSPAINVTTNCTSIGLGTAFTFTFQDEQNLTTANASAVSYILQYGYQGNTTAYTSSGNFTSVPSFSICINNTIAAYSVGYGEIDYQITGDVARKFYIFSNTRVSNQTVNITLYDLASTAATAFQETVLDTQLNIFDGYYTALLRWYPNLNQYNIVEMSKTDDNGQSVFNVQTQTVDYRVGVYSTNGTLIQLLTPTRFICQTLPCTYGVFVTTNMSDFTSFYGVQNNIDFNYTTRMFTFTWNDPSQKTSAMNLTVTDLDTNTIICSTVASGFTGVLVCDTTGYSGSLQAVAYRSASPASYIASKIVDTTSGLNQIPGNIGLIVMAAFSALTALIGIFSPIGAIVLAIIGILPAYYLHAINYMTFVGIAVLGGIAVHFLRKT